MAKVTNEFICAAFYRLFAEMAPADQQGIIRGLQANMEVAKARANGAQLSLLETHIGVNASGEEVSQ